MDVVRELIEFRIDHRAFGVGSDNFDMGIALF
ncbi:hypothetical protein HRbin07_00632 [bacterium HR07]|nr:hypothetical protein HRbin07_00632 [bacterium HR07]